MPDDPPAKATSLSAKWLSATRFLFASPRIRDFWRDSANSRNSIYVDNSGESGLAAIAQEIWAEYEAVLACSGTAGPGDRVREGEPDPGRAAG